MKIVNRDRVLELLNYNPATGIFKWKVDRGGSAREGGIAGSRKPSGYIDLKVDGQLYKAHRLAYLVVYGYMPDEVGHENQDPGDNRISNLTDLSHAENMKNKKLYKCNKTGVAGVTWHKRIEKYQAHIRVSGVSYHLGYFDNLEDATNVRNKAKSNFKFHNNHK